MEDTEIINLWKTYGNKLEESLLMNRKNTADITKLKVQSFLASMKPLKIFTILVGILWVGFVDMLVIKLWSIASPFFLVSAGIQSLLTTIVIGVHIYQLVLIYLVDINEPIVATQNKLARLKSSTIWVTRLLFLQFPVWTTFYWSENAFRSGSLAYLYINGLVTFAFTSLAVWLFVNIKAENRNKKWFRLIFEGKEWTPVIKSMELLSQIEDYQVENETARNGK
ncbi:hypothetical protein [Larkinella rosea]|uniref:Uncharacterized protein n=1 Tax=Larkinella rosea TaxID=2025312 RepID=A0A3P1BE20_9BACT|nr:hypothetical protein [Larkinella rosea]RRA98763.1 hypothetical protein EHT25_27615 [Larkinella rosea]